MKTIALILALAFAAPLAAHASPSVAQVVEQTYHTSFPAAKYPHGLRRLIPNIKQEFVS